MFHKFNKLNKQTKQTKQIKQIKQTKQKEHVCVCGASRRERERRRREGKKMHSKKKVALTSTTAFAGSLFKIGWVVSVGLEEAGDLSNKQKNNNKIE